VSESDGVTYTTSVGTTGLSYASPAVATIADKPYVYIALTGTAKAGTITVNVIQNIAGLIGNATASVSEGVVVKTFSASAADRLTVDTESNLDYVALDQNGNEITDVKTLNTLIQGVEGTNTLKFVAGASGKALLKYTPKDGAAKTRVLVFTMNANTVNVFTQTVTVTVEDARVPSEIAGLDSSVATVVTTSGNVSIKDTDLIYRDQYGDVMSAKDVEASGYKVETSLKGSSKTGVTAYSAATVSGAEIIKTTTGSANDYDVVAVTLLDAAGNAVEGTKAFNITVRKVSLNDVTDFAFEEIGMVKAGSTRTKELSVVGKYGSATVQLTSSEWTVVDNGGATISSAKLTAPKINTAADGSATTKTGTISVRVDNDDATLVTATYQYSDAVAVASKIVDAEDAADVEVTGTVKVSDLLGAVTVTDQYGEDYDATSTARVDVKSVVAEDGTVVTSGTLSKNKTNAMTYTVDAGEYTLSIEYTIGSVVYSRTVDVTVK
jgi:hypothetical protein